MILLFIDKVVRSVTVPLAGILENTRVSAHHITAIGFLVGIGCAYLFSVGGKLETQAASALLLVMLVLDYLDGDLARLRSKASLLGSFLDSISDRVRIALLLFGSAWGIAKQSGDELVWGWSFVAVSSIYLTDIVRAYETSILSRNPKNPNEARFVRALSKSLGNKIHSNKRRLLLIKLFPYVANVLNTYFLGWSLFVLLLVSFSFFAKLKVFLLFAAVYGSAYMLYSIIRAVIIYLQSTNEPIEN